MKTKVVIIDDDIDVINVYKAVLKKDLFDVFTANNKADGLKICRAQVPHIIILDVMMTTHYEGFEMKRELEADANMKNIPVLIQSSIDVLTTTDGMKDSIQDMAREFRKDLDCSLHATSPARLNRRAFRLAMR